MALAGVEHTSQAAILSRAWFETLGKDADMPWILKLAEFAGCGLVGSAIAWLRYLYGAPMSRDERSARLRYVIPFGTALLTASFIYMGIDDPVVRQPDTYPPDVVLFRGMGVVLAALIIWLVVEVRRYRAHLQGVPQGSRPYDDEDEDDEDMTRLERSSTRHGRHSRFSPRT